MGHKVFDNDVAMKLDINIYVHHVNSPAEQDFQTRVLKYLDAIYKKECVLMASLDTLTAQVKANEDIEQSAVILIQGIAAQLEAAKTDPVALQALSDSLKASASSLAAAVAANTQAT